MYKWGEPVGSIPCHFSLSLFRAFPNSYSLPPSFLPFLPVRSGVLLVHMSTHGIPLDKAELLGTVLEGILYGKTS